ncbi:hypothetical protein EGM88_09245 [Aureibaculum marinum]|uniref:Nicotinic acid mononucleotide adenyltransferase n=1 Tax=Aureibaculum marinum TaxID=2487930 RepID=A0A3N4NJG2_9FLAO|nr:class 1 isoprenoid biosynthesis enzyme [Aureibaculum marinum]RPD96542.1 hypothetical protein EGM88_09245 [Aureibaculum marinum]
MKALKIITILFLTTTLITSCVVHDDIYDDSITLEQLVTSYDLWYIDYNSTTGSIDIPFLSKAFTLSFQNGRLLANNNMVGLGSVGNGYGDHIGYYETINGVLEIDHNEDGFIDLEVIQLSGNEIKLRDTYTNTSYYLIGYQKNNFDYDFVFYDNIEYFLQEYVAWAKTNTSAQGAINEFDNENFLKFTPEQTTTFRSSKDPFGTNIDDLYWDYVGGYEVFDVEGYDNLKILTLDYDFSGNEEFELTVYSDSEIDLYHIASGTTYTFNGQGNIIYKMAVEKGKIPETRKRFKTNRKTKKRNR